MTNSIQVLDKGFVALRDHMGSDLSVVNAARVSFAKESEWQTYCSDCESRILHEECVPVLKDDDARLIKYLAKHNHWTPFGHCQVTLHFKMPIFVARQFMRSNVGIVYNEVSRRYVDNDPEFYEPTEWRGRPTKGMKQGSDGVVEPVFGALIEKEGQEPAVLDSGPFANYCNYALAYYKNLLAQGVAPEMARMVLPLNTYTEFWATMSLSAASRVVSLRADPHAQWEIQEYAKAISNLVGPLFPISWSALGLSTPTMEDGSTPPDSSNKGH